MRRYLFICCLCFIGVVKAEITMYNLTESEMRLADYTIGKLVMQDGMLSFVAVDGTVLASEKISDVVRIVFVKGPTGVQPLARSAVRIYPNPASNYIQIEGLEDTVSYRVYDLSGKCLISGHGSSVPVHGLDEGSYILQVNTQLVKFIKK